MVKIIGIAKIGQHPTFTDAKSKAKNPFSKCCYWPETMQSFEMQSEDSRV